MTQPPTKQNNDGVQELKEISALVDWSRLSRDYRKFPLKKSSGGKNFLEIPTKEDLEYLYLELNLKATQIGLLFSYNHPYCWIQFYKIKKDPKKVHELGKRTILKKYGVDNFSKTSEFKLKYKNKMIEKYGTDNIFHNVEYLKKCRKEKLGFEFASQSPEIKEKIKKTNLEHCGYTTNFLDPKNEEKKRKTCLEKYGVEYITQSEHFYKKSYETKIKNNTFTSSRVEIEWLDFLKIPEYRRHRFLRSTLKQHYVVDACSFTDKTVFEFLGDYWHGHPENKNSEFRRFKETEEKFFDLSNQGFQIIYCWEKDWREKNTKYFTRIFKDKLEWRTK